MMMECAQRSAFHHFLEDVRVPPNVEKPICISPVIHLSTHLNKYMVLHSRTVAKPLDEADPLPYLGQVQPLFQ